ncbi:MAG: hypothetical protein J6H20_08720, partial [Pyramidobacter sp.]|nr:hypothetical protein [Pyramidobacter sp.]
VGNNNTITNNDVFVLGNNVTTTVGNSVYLGSGSEASADQGNKTAGMQSYSTYTPWGSDVTFAGATPVGVVTVGSADAPRRIQNVAAGLISKDSTDAINGSQLYYAVSQTSRDTIITVTGAGSVTSDDPAQHGNVRTWTVTISDDGVIAPAGAEKSANLVTGQTVYDYVSVDSHTEYHYVSSDKTTGQNLIALDDAVYEAAASADKGWYVRVNAEEVSGSVKPGGALTMKAVEGKNLVISRDGTNITFAVSDSPVFSGMVTASGFDAGNSKIVNVASGEISLNSAEAVNGSQMYALGNSIKNSFGGSTSYDAETNTIKVGIRLGDKDYTTISEAFQHVGQGWYLKISGETTSASVAPGESVTLKAGENMTLSREGTTVTLTATGGGGGSYTAGDYISIDEGSRISVITAGIAAGSEGAGLVSGDAVYQYVTVEDGKYVKNASTTGENLSVLDNAVAANAQAIEQHTTSLDEIGATAAKGWNLGVADGELTKVAPGGNVRMAVSQDENTKLLELTESNVDDVRTITFAVEDNPTFAGTVAALGGFDARGAKIVNVAEGTADTDAVNVKQLNDAIGKSGKLAVLYDSEEKTTVTLNPGGKSAKITNLANGQVAKDSTDAVNGSQLFGIGKSIFGDTAFVNDDGSIKEYSITYEDGNTYSSVTDALYATDKTVSRMKEHFTTKKLTVNGDSEFTGNVTVGGTFTANGPAVFNDTVTMNRGLSVSGGVLNMNGNKITNLAPGTDEGDAATYGQLQSVASRADAMYSNLDSSIRRTGSRAAALAGLHPLPYDPDAPTTFTAAVGNYRGDTTAAIGLTHHFSRDAMLSVAGTIGEEPMLNAGLSLRLGRSDEKVIEARKRKRRETAEKNRLIGLVETQGKELEALKKRLHALEQRGTK